MFKKIMHGAYLSLFIIFTLEASESYNPSKVEESDLVKLQTLESSLYSLTTQKENYEDRILEVVRFLNANSLYNSLTDTEWKVEFSAKASLINGKTTEESSNHRETVSLIATYPILDSKEKKDRLKRKIDRKSSHLKSVVDYFDGVRNIKKLEREDIYFRLIEVREKVREKNGIVNLDDRLKTMKKLLDIKEKIEEFEIKNLKLKQEILFFVDSKYRDDLLVLLEK